MTFGDRIQRYRSGGLSAYKWQLQLGEEADPGQSAQL